MRHHRGKTFLSPPKLFKFEAALYFPNMQGYTIGAPSRIVDTTSVLAGKTSIVSISSGTWAEWQTQTFISEAQNPELAKEVERLGKEGLQRVWINIEEDWMKAGLIRLFLRGIRKSLKPEEWGRYFVVRRGVEDDVKMSIGMANGKVGYVYLVDKACRIRWAGSGDAVEGEREGMVACVRRLMEKVKMGDTKKIEGGRMEKALKGSKHGGEKKIGAVN
jgi:ATPase complex subunit ATP10